MHWADVVGLRDADFKRYEEHRRLIRLVTTDRLRELARNRWDDPDRADCGGGGN